MQAALMAQQIRARQSCLKNLAPLESLCQQVVVNNYHFYKSNKEHLFACLPREILEPLLNTCSDSQKLVWIDLLAQKQVKLLNIHLGINPEMVSFVCHLIQEKCKDLLGLHLTFDRNCNFMERASMSGSLSRLLKSLPHLRVLSLHGLTVTDEVLEVIAGTCTELRSFKCPNEMSQEKLCQLVRSCPELEELDIHSMICSPELSRALISLKNLRALNCSGMEQVLEELASLKPKLVLQKEIYLDKLKFRTDISTSLLVEMLPNVCDLSLKNFVDNTDIVPFVNLKHVTELSLEEMPFQSLVQSYALNLTHLTLADISVAVDLSMIGYFCLNLKELYIWIDITSECAFRLGPEHFSKMEIGSLIPLNPTEMIPDPEVISQCMYKILCAPKLKKFTSYDFPLVSQTLLQTLIAEAQQGGVVFAELEEFSLETNEDLPANLTIPLVCVMPKLRELEIFPMSDSAFLQFSAFLKSHLPNIKFPFYY